VIPMTTPEEAIEELEFAVGELGMKAAMITAYVPRAVPRVAREAPELVPLTPNGSIPWRSAVRSIMTLSGPNAWN